MAHQQERSCPYSRLDWFKWLMKWINLSKLVVGSRVFIFELFNNRVGFHLEMFYIKKNRSEMKWNIANRMVIFRKNANILFEEKGQN